MNTLFLLACLAYPVPVATPAAPKSLTTGKDLATVTTPVRGVLETVDVDQKGQVRAKALTLWPDYKDRDNLVSVLNHWFIFGTMNLRKTKNDGGPRSQHFKHEDLAAIVNEIAAERAPKVEAVELPQ